MAGRGPDSMTDLFRGALSTPPGWNPPPPLERPVLLFVFSIA